jgi:hypothetical protein
VHYAKSQLCSVRCVCARRRDAHEPFISVASDAASLLDNPVAMPIDFGNFSLIVKTLDRYFNILDRCHRLLYVRTAHRKFRVEQRIQKITLRYIDGIFSHPTKPALTICLQLLQAFNVPCAKASKSAR